MICRRALAAAALAAAAAADESHYHNYPVGDRALGMGGAYRAIADDSSGAYYNPAGLAEVPTSSFSLSAAIYGISRERLDLEIPGTLDEGESSASGFVTFPTTGAWIQAIREGDADGAGRMRAAISVVTPDSEVRRSALVARDFMLIGASVEDSTLWAGGSLAWKPHRRVSVGATLYALIRSGLYSIEGEVIDPAKGAFAQRLDASLSHYALVAMAGVLAKPAGNLSVALVLRTPSIRAAGTADTTTVDPVAGVQSGEEDMALKLPWQVALGLAWVERKRWGVAADVVYHAPVGRYEALEDVWIEKKPVVNANLGAEWYARPGWPLRAGFFTNRSAFDTAMIDGRFDADGDEFNTSLFGDDVDLYGFTVASGYELANAAITLGVSYAFGARQSGLLGLDLRRERSYLFFGLGTSFYF